MKRYDLTFVGYYGSEMAEALEGDYVHYDDAQEAIALELEAMAERIEASSRGYRGGFGDGYDAASVDFSKLLRDRADELRGKR